MPQQPHWGPAGHNHEKSKGLQQAASNIPHWITEKEAFLDRIMADTGWARASRSLPRVYTRVCTFTLHDNSYLSSLASPSLLPSTIVEQLIACKNRRVAHLHDSLFVHKLSAHGRIDAELGAVRATSKDLCL